MDVAEAKEGLDVPAAVAAHPSGSPMSGAAAQADGLDEKAAAVAEAGFIGTSLSANAALEDGPLGSRLMSLRLSEGGLAMRNSCPIPDLVPPSGECSAASRVQKLPGWLLPAALVDVAACGGVWLLRCAATCV